MSEVELLGLVAGAIVALGYIPQVVRVWRLKSAREISLPFTVLVLAGVTCWLSYGILLGLASVILWNSANMLLLSLLLTAKLKYGMVKNRRPGR
ncbi:MAG: SemiSWEET family transporter [Candidatus Hadarchaeota archaeon]